MNNRIYNYCIHLISRQDYSEYKLRQKLRLKKDNLPHEIDEAIEKLKENHLLNETNYRRLFIRKWMIKGESEEKIKVRGARENLTFQEEEFNQVRIELGFTDENNIEKLILKKLRFVEIPTDFESKKKLQDKVLRFLISKGHDFNESKKALRQYLDSL